jgi:hypothetical protein
VDPFALVIIGGVVAMILWVVLVGKLSPGSGLDQIGWKSAREVTESKEALEAEDLEQMLEAANARRRARGRPEVTVEQLEMQVVADQRDMQKHREQLDAERELDELLEATNARRRARGLPERTREDALREFGAPDASAPKPPDASGRPGPQAPDPQA